MFFLNWRFCRRLEHYRDFKGPDMRGEFAKDRCLQLPNSTRSRILYRMTPLIAPLKVSSHQWLVPLHRIYTTPTNKDDQFTNLTGLKIFMIYEHFCISQGFFLKISGFLMTLDCLVVTIYMPSKPELSIRGQKFWINIVNLERALESR
jgi:hypothetical protein